IVFRIRSRCFMTGASPTELRFRFKAKHLNACFNQFVGIKSRAFLKRNSPLGKIAATYAVHQRLDLRDRRLFVLFGNESLSRFRAGMFFPLADSKKHE